MGSKRASGSAGSIALATALIMTPTCVFVVCLTARPCLPARRAHYPAASKIGLSNTMKTRFIRQGERSIDADLFASRRNFPFTLPTLVRAFLTEKMGGFGVVLHCAQIADDPGEIDATVAAVDEPLVDGRRAGAERRGGARRARGGLRQLQILEHHRGGEARLVVAVRGRGRHQAGHRAVARHRPALPGRLRGNVEQLLRAAAELSAPWKR